MPRQTKYLPWLIGLLAATGLFAALQLFSYLRFENSDDILIVKSFMGFEGGIPATYNLYLHTLLSHFLGWLSARLPGVAWFSLLQLFCLWLAVAVVVKCAMECAGSGPVRWAGAALGLLAAGLFFAFPCGRVNFTTTAALLGAAAVAELCTVLHAPERRPLRTILSLLLLLGCYLLRPQSLLAALPFWGLALVWLLLMRRRAKAPLPRSFYATLAAGAACLLLLAGLRLWEMQDPLLRELDDFQTANLGPMDYDDSVMLSVSDETLAQIGWSRPELALVRQWYFMDENITADAFRQLNDATQTLTPLPQRLSGAFATVLAFYRGDGRYLACALFLLALGGLCIALPAKAPLAKGPALPGGQGTAAAQKSGAFLTPLAALLCLPGTAAMLLYLAFAGRFLSRAADCALFPAAALLGCLAACSLGSAQSAGRGRRLAAGLLCALCLAAAIPALSQTAALLRDRPDTVSATREADLEAFALEHPDQLILRSPDLLRDTRILPDVSAGLPVNIMIWGDWYCRTPSWYRQLELFGFEKGHFTAASFLSSRLLFATTGDRELTALLAYLEDGLGRQVQAQAAGSRGDLQFYSFH